MRVIFRRRLIIFSSSIGYQAHQQSQYRRLHLEPCLSKSPQGTGRWPEKTSGGPEGRFHPPELRETTCAVALKWLLTQGVDGPGSVAASGGGGHVDGEGEGGVGPVAGSGQGEAVQRGEEAIAERALEYRKCGRELFTKLLASGEFFVCL